ncbi:MAG: glycoside hydrolase family 15 protein [Actinomycetota bacterium]
MDRSSSREQLPIGDYALIGDCHGAALVSRAGSIDWCSFHRFDAEPAFAHLINAHEGGSFSIAPADGRARSSRSYLGDTNILLTRFVTDDGEAELVDFLARDPERGAFHSLVRMIRCTDGRVTMRIVFRPRFDYGLTVPLMEMRSLTHGVVVGGAAGLAFWTSRPIEQLDVCECTTDWELSAGEDAWFTIRSTAAHLAGRAENPGKPGRLLEDTKAFWEEWASRCSYDGPHRAAVIRSALVVKALTNEPTGAIVAAPTTSLPEVIGGTRNWDYRYAWLRDSALDVYALYRLGYTDEAHAFMDWIRRTSAGDASRLQPVYGVGGERLLTEVELDHASGYRDSRPVRIGNRAATQVQLDVYGETLDTVWLHHRHDGAIDATLHRLIVGIVDEVERRWEEPDEGIWESRGGREYWVNSKLFCWVAVDRAIKLARAIKIDAPIERWRKLRRDIRICIDTRGVDPGTGAFTRCLDGPGYDAAALLAPLVGYLPPSDARVGATVEQIRANLERDGLIYRYRDPDGLPGDEGAFVVCSFWLVDNLAMLGRWDEASALFEDLLARANDVGLMGEQVGPAGEVLGNFPQAFSHVGLIGAAVNLKKFAPRDERSRAEAPSSRTR